MSSAAIQVTGYETKQRAGVATWIASLGACFYFVWLAISLYRTTDIFAKGFSNAGVVAYSSTLFLISTYRWYYPVLFGCAAALVFVKQFFVRAAWPNLTLTLAIMVVVNVVTNQIAHSLYGPVLDLMEKLSK